MPPRKRARGDSAEASGTLGEAAPAKRQRVSLACDGCRAAREKCDGGRPQCASCLSQNRPCSYTPASKKRGVPTGYLRAIELSLAWLFEQVPGSEEALYRHLTRSDACHEANILIHKTRAGNRLHSSWTKSRVHRQIGRLLSDGRAQATGASDEDSVSETDADATQDSPARPKRGNSQATSAANPDSIASTGAMTAAIPPGLGRDRVLRLPTNWRRLVDIYFTYTHCWFPVLDRDTIQATVASYTSRGTLGHSTAGRVAHSHHAELWAAMAVAAFQDSQSLRPSLDTDSTPEHIFTISQSFLPSEDEEFDMSIVRATLVHCIILIGRGSELAASLLVGKAARLLLHPNSIQQRDSKIPSNMLFRPAFAACYVLDAVTSFCLGQAPRLRDAVDDTLLPASAQQHAEATEAWSPMHGFGQVAYTMGSDGPARAQPLLTLDQLGRFARVLNSSLAQSPRGSSSTKQAASEDLFRCLKPQFNFCNFLNPGGLTPVLPSAHLVKIMFLALTVQLNPGYRSSLLPNFLEAVESSIYNFGAGGTPPIVVSLLRLVQKHAKFSDMHAAERSRWVSASSILRDTWREVSAHEAGTETCPAAYPGGQLLQGGSSTLQRGGATLTNGPQAPRRQDQQQGLGAHQSIVPGYGTYSSDMAPSTAYQDQAYNNNASTSSVGSSRNLGMSSQPTALHANESLQLPIDYDAIREGMGAIDYTDSIDMDARFMMRLGFAPGCDLGDMFQGDFGV